MSDSLFMQQQQAASRDKESKRALEERTAMEAFRAAALQVRQSCLRVFRRVFMPVCLRIAYLSILPVFGAPNTKVVRCNSISRAHQH